MIEFGKTLRAAREAKGLTVAQVAESTRLAPSVVDGLENEDFSGIAAPIYGRGFVKLYCEAVGLAPKPLVDEFMEIFSGNRDTEIRERPVTPEPEPERGVPEAEAAAAEADVLPEQEAAPAPEPDLFTMPAEQPAPAQRFSRYAAPIDQPRASSGLPFAFPPSAWRIAALAVAALSLLVMLALGVRALYRATGGAAGTSTAGEDAAQAAPAPVAQQPADGAVKRQPQEVPALYVD